MDAGKQQKYLEFQELNTQLKQLQQQLLSLEQQLVEIRMLGEGIEEVKKAKVGDEVLAPLGSGIFLRTKLNSNSEFIMNVGAGATVTKNSEEAKAIMKQQQEELEKVIKDLSMEFQHGIMRIQQLQMELQAAQ